ncbi:RNA 3'-phosphate cyclase [Amycolatopsis rhizosphaerae]|uniref:RNA 3'-terminal phosphate cyclase n=1 Tax=Amycolatopsis rhizosphaerae TaxID=2053003 RepID=A0A558DES0_9PSEU|nr:RNA 3'-terminal phosphate cyclase [Amycolatopsis rhizosphaerae]TVT59373.1 RNA 3'-phosphate cyclase [Amycolatopsis rhizosphaerae]
MDDQPVVRVDGSLHAGSGSIVRQAVAYAALTGHTVCLTQARARRRPPGLRPQHVRAVEALRDLVGGTLDGAAVGSTTVGFSPGRRSPQGRYLWDIGSAGSATALALAVLPVLARRGRGVEAEIRGGLFQDFAPSVFHLQHVVLPLLARMGVDARLELVRPGYLPAGGGVLRLAVSRAPRRLHAITLDRPGPVRSVWGIALSSHLDERRVSARMARAARAVAAAHGFEATIDERSEATATHAGAAIALFADCEGGVRLGADSVGAPHRRAETIGARAARHLLAEVDGGATLDRFAADQVIPFAALAEGDTVFRVRSVTAHLTTGLWLASLFLDVRADLANGRVLVHGSGHENRCP